MSRIMIAVARSPQALGFLPIIIWSGSLGTIPAGYVLCDGTHGTIDLRDSFVVTDEYIDARDGSGDSIRNVSHNHVHTNSGGDEDAHGPGHTLTSGTGDVVVPSSPNIIGSIPVTGGASHGHDIVSTTVTESQSHTHGQSAEAPAASLAIDTRPPFYSLAYIKALATTELPVGSVAFVDSEDISLLPPGYLVANGDFGTPDLRFYTLQGVGSNLALLATFDAGYTHFVHTHSGTIDGAAAEHRHIYGPFGTTTDAYDTDEVDSSAGIGPIVGASHRHGVTLQIDGGEHVHTIDVELVSHDVNLYLWPVMSVLMPIIRMF